MAAVAALMLAAASLGHAEDLDVRSAWTTAGSVGIVESGDVTLRGGVARLTIGSPDGTAMIRYNIAATDAVVGVLNSGETLQLNVAFRDAGANAQVRAFVKEIALDSAKTRTLYAFDSDDREDRASGAYRIAAEQMPGIELDFQRNAYYLEVWLTKLSRGIGPAFVGASLKTAEQSR